MGVARSPLEPKRGEKFNGFIFSEGKQECYYFVLSNGQTGDRVLYGTCIANYSLSSPFRLFFLFSSNFVLLRSCCHCMHRSQPWWSEHDGKRWTSAKLRWTNSRGRWMMIPPFTPILIRFDSTKFDSNGRWPPTQQIHQGKNFPPNKKNDADCCASHHSNANQHPPLIKPSESWIAMIDR